MTFKSHRYFRQTFFSLFLRLYLIFLDEIEYRLSRAQFGFNKENSVSREAGHGKARWRVLVPASCASLSLLRSFFSVRAHPPQEHGTACTREQEVN